jgi:hypothetical protein
MGINANFREISFFPTVPTLINALLRHPRPVNWNLADESPC